jgi:hypothetical protein
MNLTKSGKIQLIPVSEKGQVTIVMQEFKYPEHEEILQKDVSELIKLCIPEHSEYIYLRDHITDVHIRFKRDPVSIRELQNDKELTCAELYRMYKQACAVLDAAVDKIHNFTGGVKNKEEILDELDSKGEFTKCH